MPGKARRAFDIQNRYRRSQHVPSLRWHRGVRVTAKAACYVIIRKGELEHDKLWFRGLQRIFRTGEVGENIGWGQSDPEDIVEGFRKSPQHERNMSDRDYTHGAYASVYSRKLGKRVWVAHYAEKG